MAVHQSGAVEHRDGDGRDEEQHQEVAAFVATLEGWGESAPHEREPEAESYEEQDGPEAAEVNVFVRRRADTQGGVWGPVLWSAPPPRAGERTDDDWDERRKEGSGAGAVELGFGAADGWRNRSEEHPSVQPPL